MTLISTHLRLSDFGICSGMGSCGTCTVEILEKGSNYRKRTLSCDVQVDEELEDALVIVAV